MDQGENAAEPPRCFADIEEDDLQAWRDHPLVVRLERVSVEELGEEVDRIAIWLREATEEEAMIEPAFSARPDRPPNLRASGMGLLPGEFWDLFPGIDALHLREEYDTGWWEAQIWLKPH